MAAPASAQDPPADPPIPQRAVPGEDGPKPEEPPPPPIESPPPEPRRDPDAPREEERLDESDGRGPAGPPPEEDDVCGPCFVIGGAVAILIAAIPLAAEADGAGRTKDSLRAWIKLQQTPAEELGFIPGYGFARESERQERFTIAAAVTGGIGGAALIAGVIWLAADGRIPGIGEGPRRVRVGNGIHVAPLLAGETIGALLSF
jgi:hypothetical protein